MRMGGPMNRNLERYEQFGWDYEHLNPLMDEETLWYLSYVRETGGPVLELACGSGRLLEQIALAGFEVEGVDLSGKMLKLAEERLSRLPVETASRIQLHNLDMTDFAIGRHYSLIIIADNSFVELKTKEMQLSCLKCVHRHLKQDGRFLMAVRRFDPAAFQDNRRVLDWSEPVLDRASGDMTARRGEFTLADDGKHVQGTLYYKTVRKDGSEQVVELAYEAPVMTKEDYLALLSEAGFRAEVYAGYRKQADDGKNPLLCFVCEKI